MSPITYNKLFILVTTALLISGCSPQVEDAVSRDYQPIYPMRAMSLTSFLMALFIAHKLQVCLPQIDVHQDR